MDQKDTICAISTPIGEGGIGIIRLSGRGAIPIVSQLFRGSSKTSLKQVLSHTVHHGHFLSPFSTEILDEVLVTIMRAPKSYTREDVVEIGFHGGGLVLHKALDFIRFKGARIASPGEFTQRAYLNGRLDLVQAEAVMEIIAAKTEEGRQSAMDQLQGGVSRKLKPLYQSVVDVLAQIEATIDFCEEGITFYTSEELLESLEGLLTKTKLLLNGYKVGRLRREGTKTVLIGIPNAGKSSLFNTLLGEEQAIVSPYPGTTRDLVQGYLLLEGVTLHLVDTAGLVLDTSDPIEKEGVRRAKAAVETADLVLLVLDGSVPLQAQGDTLSLSIGEKPHQKLVVVLNKGDLSRCLSLEQAQKVFPGRAIVSLSALSGEGVTELKEIIKKMLVHETNKSEGTLVTLARHAEALEKVKQALERALEAAQQGLSWEFLAVDLQIACQKIGEILGIETPDSVVEAIFQQFCIGK